MKPAPFDYLRVASVSEAVEALRQAGGDGKILAGGQSLVPLLALRLARPAVLIDVNRIPGLDTIAQLDKSVLRVGALVRHHRLEQQDHHPLLAEAARWIGHTAIRSRGTAGGSIAHADPNAELPVVLAVLDAAVHVSGPDGVRRIASDELFTGTFQTSLADDEMITAVDLPLPQRWGFAELARRHGDFGLVTVAVAEVDGRWRIAVGGVATTPYRPFEAEALLGAGVSTDAAIAEVAALAAAGCAPITDIHAPASYRRAMTSELIGRALKGAMPWSSS